MDVGFIGLGQMGHGMARNLLSAGHRMVVYNRTRTKAYGAMIADQKYEPAGFPMAMGLKDVRLALAAADARQVPMPMASLVHDHFLAGVATGNAGVDWAALARLSAHEAGLP